MCECGFVCLCDTLHFLEIINSHNIELFWLQIKLRLLSLSRLDIVVMMEDEEKVKLLQKGHGEWVGPMAKVRQ